MHVTGPYPKSGRLAVVGEGNRAGEGPWPAERASPLSSHSCSSVVATLAAVAIVAAVMWTSD